MRWPPRFGLTAVFVAVPLLFDIVRWAGAAYLLWLAWDAIRPHGSGGLFARRDLPPVAPAVLYRTGILTSILNPKVALFYLALFPQFVDPARGSVLVQSLILAAVQIAIAFVGDLLFVLAAARVARWLAERPAWVTAQRWVLGGVFARHRRQAGARFAAMTPEASRTGVYVKLALVAATWGSTFIAGRIVSAQMSAPVAALGRFVIATATLLVLVLILEHGLPRLSWRKWLQFTLLGAIGVAAYALLSCSRCRR